MPDEYQPAVTQTGATFAERAKAREAALKQSAKAVQSDEDGAEDKAVKKAARKKA